MLRQFAVAADQAVAFVREGDLGAWARWSAAVGADSEQADVLGRVAHNYIYRGLAIADPDVVYCAFLAYVTDLRSHVLSAR